jgi:putative endonuclease
MNSLGKTGEDEAAKFLESRGMKILARGFRTREGELDIIAAEGKTLVIVEVKTRSYSAFGGPVQAVTKSKRNKICACAAQYLKTLPKLPDSMRFDIVAIISGQPPQHIKDAFRPPRFSC